jgi:phosphoenolpyruvate carboxykinase (ATP)
MSKIIVPPSIMDGLFQYYAELLFDKAESISTEGLLFILKSDKRLIHYATGAIGLYSNPKARLPMSKFQDKTKIFNTIDHQFTEADLTRYENIFTGLRLAKEGLKKIELIGGEGKNTFALRCVFPAILADMVYGYSKIMRPASPGEAQTARKIFYQLPVLGYESEIVQAIKTGVNLIQGGNYIGSMKKPGFTSWLDYVNSVLGGFGMHAGYKKVSVKTTDGAVKNYIIVIIGDSGHGKSTLSFSNYGINDMETLFGGDDMVALIPNNSDGFRVVGYETRGLYLKVYGISATNEPFTYEGAMESDVIFENVPMDSKGMPRFDDESKSILGTTNHRAIVPLRYFTRGLPPALDVELDEKTDLMIFLLTRAPEHPAIVMHETPEHAAAFFGALPSQITSAIKAGATGDETRLTCGADEFTPGSPSQKLQRLYEVLKKLWGKATVVSINTGNQYKLEETEEHIKSLLAGTAEWKKLKEFPDRKFIKDGKMTYDGKFDSNFGALCVRQKDQLRENGAPKEVIDAL